MRMDDPSQEDPVTTSLRNLNHLAKHLRKERIRKGWVGFEWVLVLRTSLGFLGVGSVKEDLLVGCC